MTGFLGKFLGKKSPSEKASEIYFSLASCTPSQRVRLEKKLLSIKYTPCILDHLSSHDVAIRKSLESFILLDKELKYNALLLVNVLEHPSTIFKAELEKKLQKTEDSIAIAAWLMSEKAIDKFSLEQSLVSCSNTNTRDLWKLLISDTKLVSRDSLENALKGFNVSCFYCAKAINASSDKMKNDYEQLIIEYHNENTGDAEYLYELLRLEDVINRRELELALISSGDFFHLALHYVISPPAIDRDRIEIKLAEMTVNLSSLLSNAYKERDDMYNKRCDGDQGFEDVYDEIEKMDCSILISKAHKYGEALVENVFRFNGRKPGNGSGNQPPMWISGYKIKNIALEQALLKLMTPLAQSIFDHKRCNDYLLEILLNNEAIMERKPFLKMLFELKKKYPNTQISEYRSRSLRDELNTLFGECF